MESYESITGLHRRLFALILHSARNCTHDYPGREISGRSGAPDGQRFLIAHRSSSRSIKMKASFIPIDIRSSEDGLRDLAGHRAPSILRRRDRTMTPVSFDGCFGWLHIPPARLNSDTTVLVCPPLGCEALRSHRSLRALADDLATAGYPTLRFDYPGTGDSCDGEIENAGG